MKVRLRYTPPTVADYVMGLIGVGGMAVALRLSAAMPPDSLIMMVVGGLLVSWLVLAFLRMGSLELDSDGIRGGRMLGFGFDIGPDLVDDISYVTGTLRIRAAGKLRRFERTWPRSAAVRMWLGWWHKELPDTAFVDGKDPPKDAVHAVRKVVPHDARPWTDEGFIVEDSSDRVYLPIRVMNGKQPPGMPPLAMIPIGALLSAICVLSPADRRLHLRRLARELHGSVLEGDATDENTAGWNATITLSD